MTRLSQGMSYAKYMNVSSLAICELVSDWLLLATAFPTHTRRPHLIAINCARSLARSLAHSLTHSPSAQVHRCMHLSPHGIISHSTHHYCLAQSSWLLCCTVVCCAVLCWLRCIVLSLSVVHPSVVW